MALARFKLKKADASTELASFEKQPNWRDLVSKISLIFDIPPDNVIVSHVDKNITLHNEEELQRFYRSLGPSSESIKFVVQDIKLPDRERIILFQAVPTDGSFSFPSPPILMRLRCLILHFCFVDLDDIPHLPAIGSSLLNQRQSLQLGRRIPAYLIYPTAVSNQQ
jgi:hypothetical protein